MAALVAPGAPVSVLIEYGLSELLVEKLVATGIGTIEQLGSMTPEQLEEIQDVGPQVVETIQEAVNAYYSQFEEPPAAGASEAVAEAAEAVAESVEAETAAEAETAVEEAASPAVEAESEAAAEQFGTIGGAASPTHNPSEGHGPEGTEPD